MMNDNNKTLKLSFIILALITLSFLLSSCTHSSSNGGISKAYFEFSSENATVNDGTNFTGWWKLYAPKNIPESALIEVLSRNNSEKIAIDAIILPQGYVAKGQNYTYASKVTPFYSNNDTFECCKPSFNESGTYYVDLYLYNCTTLNAYFINSCERISDYAKNIIAANPKGLHQRMQIKVS